MNIIAIDPDYRRPGYALFINGGMRELGTFQLDDKATNANLTITWIKHEFANIYNRWEGVRFTVVVEVAVLGDVPIWVANENNIARNALIGALKRKGTALSRCQFIGGIIAGIAAEKSSVDYLEPKEWNVSRQSKKSLHEGVFRQYPEIKAKRKKYKNGVTDDSIDAFLIGEAYLKKQRYNLFQGEEI